MPVFDGNGNIDIFFTKFETLVKTCQWSEQESISRLLSDCLQGDAATFLLSLPQDFEMTYSNFKKKIYTYYSPGNDVNFYQQQLLEITRKSGESLQEFCGRVVMLANKAYPFPSYERENGVTTIIRGCNSDYVKQAALTNTFQARTIDEAVGLLVYNKVFQIDRDQLRLCSVRKDSPCDQSPETPSDNERRSCDSRSVETRDSNRDLPANYAEYGASERCHCIKTYFPISNENKHQSSHSNGILTSINGLIAIQIFDSGCALSVVPSRGQVIYIYSSSWPQDNTVEYAPGAENPFPIEIMPRALQYPQLI